MPVFPRTVSKFLSMARRPLHQLAFLTLYFLIYFFHLPIAFVEKEAGGGTEIYRITQSDKAFS